MKTIASATEEKARAVSKSPINFSALKPTVDEPAAPLRVRHLTETTCHTSASATGTASELWVSPRIQWSEKHPAHHAAADRAHKLTRDAVVENQNQQKDLDRPEMRPHNLGEQLLVGAE